MLDGAENQGGTAVETQVNGETNSQGGETTAPQGETHAESAPKEGTDSGADAGAIAAQQNAPGETQAETVSSYAHVSEVGESPAEDLKAAAAQQPAAPIGAAAIASGALAGANARQAVAEPAAVVTDFVLYHPLHPTKTAEGTYDTVEESAVFNNGVTHDDALAALVVRVFPATDEQPASVNLLVFTDGGGIVHKQNVVNGTGLGQWSWA